MCVCVCVCVCVLSVGGKRERERERERDEKELLTHACVTASARGNCASFGFRCAICDVRRCASASYLVTSVWRSSLVSLFASICCSSDMSSVRARVVACRGSGGGGSSGGGGVIEWRVRDEQSRSQMHSKNG